MTCNYCGKEIEGDESAELYAGGKLASAFCSSTCMQKGFKKTLRVLKKMTQGKAAEFLNAYNAKPSIPAGKKSKIVTVEIPLVKKHHCCSDCKKFQPRKRWCKHFDKSITDCALKCKPKPEWEKT